MGPHAWQVNLQFELFGTVLGLAIYNNVRHSGAEGDGVQR